MIGNDIVVIGAAHRPGGVPRGKTNVKWYGRGYDVSTGKRLWIFHTIPDLRTGQRKWHFQFVHHGIWDWHMANPPILANITVDGRAIRATIQPTKQWWLYVFDRASGQPVWPIVELLASIFHGRVRLESSARW
jgi:glucose dehydrogenase